MLKETPCCPQCGSELVAPFYDADKLVIQCTNCGYFGSPKMKPGEVRQ